jgi:hypothetical protein
MLTKTDLQSRLDKLWNFYFPEKLECMTRVKDLRDECEAEVKRIYQEFNLKNGHYFDKIERLEEAIALLETDPSTEMDALIAYLSTK